MEQAFFIMPPLNGPGMDNQGVLMVSLGVATAAEPHPIPEPQQVSAGHLGLPLPLVVASQIVGVSKKHVDSPGARQGCCRSWTPHFAVSRQ